MTSFVARGTPGYRLGTSQGVFGLIAALGGALYLIAGLRVTLDSGAYDKGMAVFSLLWSLGGVIGLVGIARLGVAGRGLLGRAALVVAFTGFGCAMVAWLTGFDDPAAVDDSAFMNIGRVLRLLGFLGLGVATARTRSWSGRRRLTPFLYPVAVVLGLLSSALLDLELTVALIGLAWAGIGWIVATSNLAGDTHASGD